MRDAPDDLESTLDRLIGRLAKPGAPREARALLLDARRLRTLVGNWRTIAPTPEAREQMALRVEQIRTAADSTVPEEAAAPSPPPPAPSPPPAAPKKAAPAAEAAPRPVIAERPAPARPREQTWDDPPSLIVPARSYLPLGDDETRAAPIATKARADHERAAARQDLGPRDPERPRTLPDLDISGLAQMLDEGPGLPFDEPLDPRPTAARPSRLESETPPRGRGASETPPRGRGASETPPRGRAPSETPPRGRAPADDPAANGRRRDPALDPLRPTTSRVSRIFTDEEAENALNGGGRVYPASPGEEAPAQQRLTQRITHTPSSSPPNAVRGDKTLIAVRPLPAPEVLDKRLIMLNEPYSTRADAFRGLRRKLSGPGAPRTIAVTSAQPEEGKTSCAVNLALAFRETSSEKVLLIEANLKAPALAKLFGFEPPVCFAKQMAKNRDLPRASWTVAEQFEPLHVLAVDPSSKTSPLLDPVAFANALEQLVEAGYDHIIVDTPPALGGSDVNLIADAVDGMVIVAWIKKSKRSLVKKAIDQLKPATILGVVTLDG